MEVIKNNNDFFIMNSLTLFVILFILQLNDKDYHYHLHKFIIPQIRSMSISFENDFQLEFAFKR
ncbi:hypothetical protein MTP04_33210 [Lysinibacillus sp. PLM2]|nr:hypothetical protein MTP04_33210 [Lysinibacillus sp. PLM2]